MQFGYRRAELADELLRRLLRRVGPHDERLAGKGIELKVPFGYLLRFSGIKRFKPMADFDWSWPAKIERDIIERALTLDFLVETRNLILVGRNGLGKTMIAQNIAHTAVLAGHTAIGVGLLLILFLPLYLLVRKPVKCRTCGKVSESVEITYRTTKPTAILVELSWAPGLGYFRRAPWPATRTAHHRERKWG